MKRFLAAFLSAVLLCVLLCACNTETVDYSNAEGNITFVDKENEKILTDTIGLRILSADEAKSYRIKTFKTDYEAEDFTAKFSKLKLASPVSANEIRQEAEYPQKLSLPQYDLEKMQSILLVKYYEKYGEELNLADNVIVLPKFSTRSFTGKLVVSYTIYSGMAMDENGEITFSEGKTAVMEADLYTFDVE